MPSSSQRCMPRSPLSRQRLSPWRRLTTLMRPSQPVLHFLHVASVSRNHGITLLAFRVEESGRNRTWFNSQMASMASFSFW